MKGDESKNHIFDPKQVTLPAPIGSIDTGLQHCIAASRDGNQLFAWGKGSYFSIFLFYYLFYYFFDNNELNYLVLYLVSISEDMDW